jgi:hypothetical protein
MDAIRESLPSVTLALILTLGERSEAIPVFHHDLLVDAAAFALRDLVEDARRETDPVAAAAKKEEAIIFKLLWREEGHYPT